MTLYRLTPDAQSDLIEIRRFTVKQWGIVQSKKYLSELRQTIQLLAVNSSLGKTRPEIGEGVFSFPHASHIIYYVIHKRQLVVFGVLHKRMVPMNPLDRLEVV